MYTNDPLLDTSIFENIDPSRHHQQYIANFNANSNANSNSNSTTNTVMGIQPLMTATLDLANTKEEDPFCPLPISHTPAWDHKDSVALVSQTSLFATSDTCAESINNQVELAFYNTVPKIAKSNPSAKQTHTYSPPCDLKTTRPGQLKHSERKSSSSSILTQLSSTPTEDHTSRYIRPLATEEDSNWLSDFLCFVRSDILEVFQATPHDVSNRANSKKIIVGQVGVRCRFCAHYSRSHRARRAACFPSSVNKIYQSFTMMSRDHFSNCAAMPTELKEKYHMLKGSAKQGAADSKRYWALSAERLGMVDSPNQGMIVMRNTSIGTQDTLGQCYLTRKVTSTHSDNEGMRQHNTCSIVDSTGIGGILPTLSSQQHKSDFVQLVGPNDATSFLRDFPYTSLLVQQIDRVFLLREEILGNRRSLPENMPGFGCKYCAKQNRKGKCRFFPARRRTLPIKLFHEFQDHLSKCQLCPSDIKKTLKILKDAELSLSFASSEAATSDEEHERRQYAEKQYLDLIWSRLHTRKSRT